MSADLVSTGPPAARPAVESFAPAGPEATSPSASPTAPATTAFMTTSPALVRSSLHARPPVASRGRMSGGEQGREQVAEVVGEEARLHRLALVRQAALETADRVAAAFRMRIVRREQIELRPGFADEGGNVLERIGREAQLVADLLGGLALHEREVRLRLRPDVGGVVQAADHVRDPAGAELDDAAAQRRKTVEHAVENERRDEPLRRVVDDGQVLRADDLGAAAGGDAVRVAVVHPGRRNLQRG